MDESKLRVFVDGAVRYFSQVTRQGAEVMPPYLTEPRQSPAYDYTGIIGISGSKRGCVYFTAPSAMLRELLLAMGEADTGEENLADACGEVANTISGNARREFGAEFMISVPVVVPGAPQGIHLPKDLRSFVIPIGWKKHRAGLVVTLE